MLLGGILVGLGAFFGLAGALALKGNRTAFPRPRANSRLIREGIYSRVRHPLYTSVMLVSAGWAIAWNSPAAVAVTLAMVPFFYAKARLEESWLAEKFPDYQDYAKRVPRFIPWRR